MKKISIVAFITIILAACVEDKGYQQSIVGDWKGVNWTVENQGNRDVVVKFHFEGSNYQATLGDREEKGTFRVQGDKLYTKAEGQQEIMVRIEKLTADSMVFEMNRGGVKEEMTLIKG